MNDEDSWWSEECAYEEAHADCPLRACDCPCHFPNQLAGSAK